MAIAFGQFIGAFLLAVILTTIISALIRRFTTTSRVFIANGLSLTIATLLGGLGMADGGDPDFFNSFGTYVLPQLAVFAIDFLRSRGAAARGRTKPKSMAFNRADPPMRGAARDIAAPAAPSSAAAASGPEADRQARLLPPPIEPAGPTNPRKNFIVRHWRGELSLGWSFWGIAVLGNIVALITILVLNLIFSTDTGYDPAPLFWLNVLTWLVVTLIAVWQVVGTWRSATHHAERRAALSLGAFWSRAAKVSLGLGVLRFLSDLVNGAAPQLAELYDMAWRGDPRLPAYSLRVMRDGTEIEITGGIKFGLAADFERVIKASPRIKVVHLHSFGGRLGEAEKLRQNIEARGLITYVSARCESACTLIFAGGRERWAPRSGGLGYHGPAFPGMTAADLAPSVLAWKAAYVEAGLSTSFVDRGLAVPSDKMWRPTIQELVAANAVTHQATGSEFAISGYGANPTPDQLLSPYRKGWPALAAIQARLPDDYERIRRVFADGFTAGATEDQIIADYRAVLARLLAVHRSKADDQVLIDQANLLIDQYRALGRSDPTLCYQYAAFGGGKVNTAGALSDELTQRDLMLQERMIMTSGPHPPIPEAVSDVLLSKVRQSLIRRYGADRIAIFAAETVAPAQHADYCAISTAFYQEIVAMPPAMASTLLRALEAQ